MTATNWQDQITDASQAILAATHQPAARPPASHPAPKPTPRPGTGEPGIPTSAKGILTNFLNAFGLGALADWAWKTYAGAGGGDVGMQIVQAELPSTKEFQARFPAIGARQKAGLAPISPADYVNYENGLRQSFVAHGLAFPTTGTKFNAMVDSLLTHDVSMNEVVNDRIGTAFARVAGAPPEVKQAAEKMWGVSSDQALASLFLDPNQNSAELDKLSQAMDIAGNASRLGIDVTKEHATHLAHIGADNQISKLSDLALMAPLFNENVGEGQNLKIGQEGVAAAFGEDATSQAAINRRLQARKAAFSGGGEPTSSSRITAPGITGLGSGSGV